MMAASSTEHPETSWSRITTSAYGDSTLGQHFRQTEHPPVEPPVSIQFHEQFQQSIHTPRTLNQYDYSQYPYIVSSTFDGEWNIPFRFHSERSTSIESNSSLGFVVEEITDDSHRYQAIYSQPEEMCGNDAEELDAPTNTKVEIPDTSQASSLTAMTINEQPMFRSNFPMRLKKPRGRPRKHPIIVPDPSTKCSKGRSKTGCYTCRRRKKKCDETKPECDNCQKNGVICEGYPKPHVWKSPKEKFRATDDSVSQPKRVGALDVRRLRCGSLYATSLNPYIDGTAAWEDTILLEYFTNEVGMVLTTQCAIDNPFIQILLPMAYSHHGIFHSILSLSSFNINFESTSGKDLLRRHPETNRERLELCGREHFSKALKVMMDETTLTLSGVDDNKIDARYGQMICLLAQGLCTDEGLCIDDKGLYTDDDQTSHQTSRHSPLIKEFQKLFIETKPVEPKFRGFITEYFDFHIIAQELSNWPDDDWKPPEQESEDTTEYPAQHSDFTARRHSIVGPSKRSSHLPEHRPTPSTSACLLGFQDELFYYISEITAIRNTIRYNMKHGYQPLRDPHVLRRIPELYSGLQKWEPDHGIVGKLYKRMAWIYLFRTTHIPTESAWFPDPILSYEVDIGLGDLKSVPPGNPQQTVLLMPTFIIGCAAFEIKQREVIRECISTIFDYTHLKNSQQTLKVLEKVWCYMDSRDPMSWDWQKVAQELRISFLAT